MDFGSRRTVRVYVSTVLFYFLSLNGNVFLVYTRALKYNEIGFLHTFKSCNKEIGKPDESLGRKAIGPVKW